MILYVESSAILAWLLGEPSATVAMRELRAADSIVTSSLTALECARGLSRAKALGRITNAGELAALRLLDEAEASWDVHDLSERVIARARGSFQSEPVRTLDALHLATALIFKEALGELCILTFDQRILDNALAMGIAVRPL